VTVTADDTLHFWNFQKKNPVVVHCLKFQRERYIRVTLNEHQIDLNNQIDFYLSLFSIALQTFIFQLAVNGFMWALKKAIFTLLTPSHLR
jgi:hypothetical protein